MCRRRLMLALVMSVFGFLNLPTSTCPRPSTAMHSAPEGQETSFNLASTTFVGRHAEAPPRGLVDVTTVWPLSAMQSDGLGHDIRPNTKGDAAKILHALRPPVGFVEVTTCLAEIAQNDGEGQDTPNMKLTTPGLTCTPTRTVFQADAAPVGRVELTTALPAATQRGPVTHDTLERSSLVGTTLQALVPPVGLVVLAMPCPKRLTATHSRGEAHETSDQVKSSPRSMTFQAAAPPVG